MGEMAVVGNNYWFFSHLTETVANIPIYVDQAESILLLITVETVSLAASTIWQESNEHDMVIPDFVVQRTRL